MKISNRNRFRNPILNQNLCICWSLFLKKPFLKNIAKILQLERGSFFICFTFPTTVFTRQKTTGSGNHLTRPISRLRLLAIYSLIVFSGEWKPNSPLLFYLPHMPTLNSQLSKIFGLRFYKIPRIISSTSCRPINNVFVVYGRSPSPRHRQSPRLSRIYGPKTSFN